MKNKKVFFGLLVACMLAFAINLYGVGGDWSSVESYLKTAKPGWELQKSKTASGKATFHLDSTSSEGLVIIQVKEYSDHAGAHQELHKKLNFLTQPAETLTGFGDEAFCSLNASGACALYAVKGNVFMHINSSSVEVAKELGANVFELSTTEDSE